MTNLTPEQWASALESGQFHQDKRALRTEDGYCCLGVAATLIDPTAWRECTEDERPSQFPWTWNGETKILPVISQASFLRDIASQSLLDDAHDLCHVEYYGINIQDLFARLNDAGVSFRKIAALIRKHLVPMRSADDQS